MAILNDTANALYGEITLYLNNSHKWADDKKAALRERIKREFKELSKEPVTSFTHGVWDRLNRAYNKVL